MAWLDVLTASCISNSCPACPASKNIAGQLETVDTQALSSTSSMSSKGNGSGEILPDFMAGDPTPEQIAHARRMLVDCPAIEGKRHCWHCSRCDDARRCAAWRSRCWDVEFFRSCGKPYSLHLIESDKIICLVMKDV